VRKNLLAGLVSSIWAALIGLAIVPFYLKYLGIEAYGLIGFFITTQSLLQLLDLGLAPTINREVARCSVSGNLHGAARLLHTLAIIYWGMAGVIALILVSLAPFITEYWLKPQHLPPETVTQALMLIGLVVAFRWPVGLYQGALMGAQRLAVSSAISVAMVTLGSIGAVGVLVFVAPTIQAFFIWQAIVGLIYAFTVRQAAWRIVGRKRNERVRFDMHGLRRVWRFSAGMSGIAMSAIILMQLDKVLLSKILSLQDFGRYMLAGTLAAGLYVLLTPVFNAVFPRMSALVADRDTDKLMVLYRSGTRLLLAALFPLAIAVAIFSKNLVFLWTGNTELSATVAPIVSLFVIGTALNGVMHFPYALQLAYGVTRLPLMINAILMVVLVPATIVLSVSYGAVGGAAAWVILNIVYVLLGTWLTHRVLLKGIAFKWLAVDVAVPLAVSLLIVGLGGTQVTQWGYPYYVELAFAAALAFLAFLMIILLSPSLITRARSGFAQVTQ
jgi:O-antigen/teichoic acid export membrane protein